MREISRRLSEVFRKSARAAPSTLQNLVLRAGETLIREISRTLSRELSEDSPESLRAARLEF